MKKTNIQPLGKNVLIEIMTQEEKTQGGIYLPENATQEKPQQGIVVAVGSDDDIFVKKGQSVIYNRYSGTDIKHEGREFVLVKNKDILAIVE